MRKRNVLLGGLLAAVIIGSSSLSASAATWNEGSTIATQGGGDLSLMTQQYSMNTVYVKAYYSEFLYPDTVIDVTATDVATGKVASTSHIDNDTWVRERVLDGFTYGHTYNFSATLSWKDGSNSSVKTQEVASQKIEFTDEIKDMTFKTLNKDVPVTELAGTVYRAQIKYSSKTDPQVFKLPSQSKAKVSKVGKAGRAITWGAASTNGGYQLASYTVNVSKNGKTIANQTVDADGARSLKLKNLARGSYKMSIKSTNISGNFTTATSTFKV